MRILEILSHVSFQKRQSYRKRKNMFVCLIFWASFFFAFEIYNGWHMGASHKLSFISFDATFYVECVKLSCETCVWNYRHIVYSKLTHKGDYRIVGFEDYWRCIFEKSTHNSLPLHDLVAKKDFEMRKSAQYQLSKYYLMIPIEGGSR